MRIIFFGTPDYVIPVVERLHKTFKAKTGESPIVAVVTQPPKPIGRKQQLEYSPVDTWAHKKGIKIIRELDIKGFPEADLGILASYGMIIPDEILKFFPYGILNIHPSLLPKWRGSSPVQATITEGKEAGATVIKLDEKMDHGPIVAQFKDEIKEDDTTFSLRNRLFERSAEIITDLIPAYIQGKFTPREQDHDKTTFTREIKKENAYIPTEVLNAAVQGLPLKGEWNIQFLKDYVITPSPKIIERFIRAMQPWPESWTTVQLSAKDKGQNTKRLKILKSHLETSLSTKYNLPSTKLVLDEVQLEGKNPVSWKQFIEGYPEVKFK